MGTYSFQDVTVSMVGPGGDLDLGAGSGNAKEGVTVARAGDKNTMTIGADGEGMHSLHADKSGTVTLRYLKTSPMNAKLMAMYDLQTAASTLHGKNLIIVRMPNVGDIHTCRQCAFKKVPDMNYKDDGDTNEWVFDAIKIDSLLGTY